MLNKVLNIFLKLIILILIIQFLYTSNSYASTWGDIIGSGQNFINEGKNAGVAINSNDLQDMQNDIYNFLLALGVAIMVIVGAILGIIYMFGSIEQQVKVKETLIGYVIGCIVIFSAFGIWRLVINIASNII